MTDLADDDFAPTPGAPADVRAPVTPSHAEGRTGAHAQPIEVPSVPARRSVVDRRRYFLSSVEPSGEFDAVIIAVTDGARRRYFTTRDGVRMDEVDHDWFDRRSSEGGRSLLELDDRELGELEAELGFVRPVRGRDPIAEAEEEAGDDVDEDPQPERDDDAEAVTEDAETTASESRRSTFVHAAPAASVDETEPVASVDEAEPAASVDEAEPAASVDDTERETAPDADPEPEPQPAAAEPPALAGTEAVEQVALAKGIAFVAHRGQLDRGGAPYIDHPGRMAERFDPATHPLEAAAAWLHDVLEDTPVTAQELFEAGVRPDVIEVVRLLTRSPEVAAEEYYARIRAHDAARRVKLADIDDNTARWRLRRLDYETQLRLVEKYRVARRALGG
ncbi:GTP pyrophosphokinase [Agromyces sp. NDB4Y10]|uniref:hypothetical protein n=1 Tax=Agromyces sp. NDB4Y10 TaxID=1775951 RepID=UPI0007B287A8|nr:hypothetical protein [Agromyces sp. NDB4Y10]KZE95405.1 GTP pyrophosphokinase [Agromyces sp. NDB4Y10]